MTLMSRFVSRLDLRTGSIDMTHGSGGRATAQLVAGIFARHFANDVLAQGNDAAGFDVPGGRMVMSTDGHVVSPLFFPGGDIGCLAVNGTLNDVAMMGGRPLYLSAAFIIEEGFPLAQLDRIASSMGAASRAAKVPIVTGDTKVVEKGKADGVFITTTGVGVVPAGLDLSGSAAQPGDKILLSGPIGDHGIAILSKRANVEFETEIMSDTAPLHTLVERMLDAVPQIRCLRDPTRGGLGTTLNEIAQQSRVGMRLREVEIPVSAHVQAACELLGLDPLYIANEGKLIAICPAVHAQTLLAVMQAHSLASQAAIIGEVVADNNGFVQMATRFGGSRIVDWLSGEQLPRIC